MRVNQGLVLLSIAIAGLVIFHFIGLKNSIFYFVMGVGLARLDDWWGEEKSKEKKQKK